MNLWNIVWLKCLSKNKQVREKGLDALGRGQQYKAVESLSRGIPIIISTKAAEALSLKDRVNCFVANNVEEYFKCIITLMNSYEKYQEISYNYYSKVLLLIHVEKICGRFLI